MASEKSKLTNENCSYYVSFHLSPLLTLLLCFDLWAKTASAIRIQLRSHTRLLMCNYFVKIHTPEMKNHPEIKMSVQLKKILYARAYEMHRLCYAIGRRVIVNRCTDLVGPSGMISHTHIYKLGRSIIFANSMWICSPTSMFVELRRTMFRPLCRISA